MSVALSAVPSEASNNAFLDNLVTHGQFPAAAAPLGQTHNLINPYSRGYLAGLTLSFSLPIMIILVSIRVYTKHWVNKFGLDKADYTCIIAFVSELSYMALGQVGAHYGGGTHQWNLTAERAIHVARIANIMEIVYNPAAFFTKLSITLQILRIFGGMHRGWVYWLCHTTIWFNALFQTAMMLVAIFHCQPAEKYWEPWLPGHCIAPNAPLLVSAAVSTATDLILFLVPIICIWHLQMSTRQKAGISIVFATAFFAVFCSIMRIVSTVWFIHSEDDATYGFTDLALWTFGEVAGGIVSSCMPAIPQFARHIRPKLASVFSTRSSSSSSQAGTSFWHRSASSSAAEGKKIGCGGGTIGSPAPRRGQSPSFNWSKASTAVHSRDLGTTETDVEMEMDMQMALAIDMGSHQHSYQHQQRPPKAVTNWSRKLAAPYTMEDMAEEDARAEALRQGVVEGEGEGEERETSWYADSWLDLDEEQGSSPPRNGKRGWADDGW